jgi:hypothetical protein
VIAQRMREASRMKTLLALCVVLAAACHHSDSSPTTTPPSNSDTPGSASASTCPPATHPDAICAAVVTYAKAPDGTCCMYPSPCTVAVEGQQYSDEKCTTAMGGGAQ